MDRKKVAVLFAMIVVLFSSCGEDGRKEVRENEAARFVLEGDETVLATVDNTPITKYELDLTVRTTLRRNSADQLDERSRRKVLESLVAGRALSLLAEKELTEKESAEIDKKMNAYREQLLVRKYLSDHTTPEPVTSEMVKAYYGKHPEKFGKRTVRYYEMITASRVLDQAERDNFIKYLGAPQKNDHWGELSTGLRKKGLPAVFKKGEVLEKIFHPKLTGIISRLEKGAASNLIFIERRPYVIRITNETNVPPRPLNDVSSVVRKALAPVQLKKAVKKASEEAVQKVEVIYR